MAEKIKNYTSEVPMERTVARIETFLVSCGARDILKNYSDKQELEGISFKIERHNKVFAFKLPASVYGVARILYKMDYHKLPENKQKQAQRTAWKCVQDWVELQMTMVKLEQADVVEVFLPYMYIKGETLYKQLMNTNFTQLQLT